MTTKKKLQAFFDSPQDDLKYIQVYEENRAFFDELLGTGRWEELDFVIPIKLLKYADPLNKSGNHTKALRVLKEVERDLPKLKGRSKWHDRYDESLNFLTGVCLSKMKRYKESNIHFAELLRRNKAHDNYANWYRSNLKAMVSRYSSPVMIAAFSVYLVLFFLGLVWPELEFPMIKAGAMIVALLAIVGPWFHGKWVDARPLPGGNHE